MILKKHPKNPVALHKKGGSSSEYFDTSQRLRACVRLISTVESTPGALHCCYSYIFVHMSVSLTADLALPRFASNTVIAQLGVGTIVLLCTIVKISRDI
jgi:hypothetical protein